MQYWQVAAGSEGRDYSNLFLRFGMAFVGGEANISTMEQVNEDDIVVLKQGTQKIVAVGQVIKRYGKHQGCGDKEWLRDIDGWDLPAYCYVDWKQPETDTKTKETHGLTRTTIQGINIERIKNEANEILDSGSRVEDPREPPDTNSVEDSEILKCLIKAGLSPSSADELTNAISRIRLLADYYYMNCKWSDIREHETRTFLVVPLLLALGWAEQQIKIELACDGGKVDIALFRKNFERNMDDCVAIIETKGFSSGLDYADKQAKTYSRNFPGCKTIVITNGYCYKIYEKNGADNFEEVPSAYMNLLKPKDKYPLDPDNVKGTLEAITWLLPNSYSG